MKTNKHIILGAIASLLLISFIPVTQALTPSLRNTCDEGIHPYDNSLPKSTDNSAIAHKYGDDCRNDMKQPFPNQHIQPVDPATHEPAKTGLNVKGLKHTHRYFNDSDQDDGTNNYYYAYVAQFEIRLEEDFMKNVDLTTLKCAVPVDGINPYNADFEDCNGYDPEVFGGTRLERQGNLITYTFGINHGWDKNNGKAGKPIIPGKDPDIDQGVYFAKDTTNEINRMFEARVDADSLDKSPQTIWSATTTARALVKHIAIQQSAFDSGKNHACGEPGYNETNAWCGVPVSGYQTEPGYTDYHWFPLGTDSTVWKREVTPPPSSECTGLSITNPKAPILTKTGSGPAGEYEMTPDTETTFDVLPTFSNGEVPLDYRWEATGLTVPMSASITPVKGTETKDGYAATLLAAATQYNESPVGDIQATTPGSVASIFAKYGFFADDSSKKDLSNPYTDKNNPTWYGGSFEDRSTYYTGGPSGTLIRVQGVDPTTGQYVGNNCQATIVIPSEEEQNTCIDLEINPTSLDEKTPVTFTVTPKFENDTPVISLDYLWSTKDGSTGYNPGQFDLNTIGDVSESFQKAPTQMDSEEDSYTTPAFEIDTNDQSTSEFSVQPIIPDEVKKPDVQYEQPKVPNPKPEVDPVNQFSTFNAADLKTDLLAAAPGPVTSSSSQVQPAVTANPAVTPFVTNFDKFADSATATDYANPYTETESTLQDDRSTYYTGGNAGQIISVQGFNKETGEVYPLCKADLQIPPTPPGGGDKCLDLDIVQGQVNPVAVGDEVPLEDPIEGLWVRVNTDPQEYEADLEFAWEVTGGGLLNTVTENSTRIVTTNFADTVNLTGAQEGTVVKVAAADPENKLENIEICKDQFTVTESPQLMCRDLRLSPERPVFGPGEKTYLKGSPINTDDSLVAKVDWYEEGPGHFEKGPASLAGSMFPYMPQKAACPEPSDFVTGEVTEFTAPARCDYFYVAGADGGGLVRVSANPNLGNVDNCIFEAKVPSIPGNVECLSLDFDQNQLKASQTQTLTGDVTFSDGITRDVVISWAGKNASIAEPNPQSTSSDSFSKNVKVAEAPAEVTAGVIATNDPAVDTNSFANCTDTLSTTPEEEDCREIELNYNRRPGYVCVDVTEGTYEKEYVWYVEGEKRPEEGECIRESNFNEDDYLVYAKYDRFDCRLENSPSEEENPPEFDKFVRQSSGKTTGYKSVVSASLDPKNPTEFDYQLTFTSKSDGTTATITDPDMLRGITGHLLPEQYANEYNPGKLTYNENSTRVYGIPACDENEDEEDWNNCYSPYPPDVRYGIDLIKLNDNTEVRITYSANIIGSPISDPDICKDGKVCEEYYENRARADWKIIGSSEQVLENGTLWDTARIQAFCQYILTRAAGDIFLETDLGYGVDINKCSEFTTSTGVIVTPGTPETPIVPSTGAGQATIFSINHEICSEGQAGTLNNEALEEFYGQGISERLSSEICEVKLQTGNPWKQEIITNNIEENKLRLARWGADYNYDVTLTPAIATNDVTYIKGNLTIPSTGYTLDKGAKTFIVEGDLIINGDIKYNSQTSYQSVRDTASLAFIVLGGNVVISNDVTEISGVYFVQESENGEGGQLVSSPNEATYNPLIVYGSIYGDIEPLFGNRLFAGDPSEDAGGIVIRFDQRILLNTPPGLRDVLDVSQTEVAR